MVRNCNRPCHHGRQPLLWRQGGPNPLAATRKQRGLVFGGAWVLRHHCCDRFPVVACQLGVRKHAHNGAKVKHMSETTTIEVKRYRDPQGRPTCRAKDGNCPFLEKSYRFGELCRAVPDSNGVANGTYLFGRVLGFGSSLLPTLKCPVWAEKTVKNG